MKYRVSFEMDVAPGHEPGQWSWYSLLSSVNSDGDSIIWETLRVEKNAGWTNVPIELP